MFKLVFRLALVTSIFAGSFFITAHAQSFFTSTPPSGTPATTIPGRQMITVDQFQQSAKQSIDAAKQALSDKVEQQKQLAKTQAESAQSTQKGSTPASPTQLTSPASAANIQAPSTSISPSKPQDMYTGFKPVNSNNSVPTSPAPPANYGSGNSSGWSIKY